MVPVGSRWAVIVNVCANLRRSNLLELIRVARYDHEAIFYERNPHLTDEDDYWQRFVSFRPSFVRTFRREHLSFWFGGGLDFEWMHDLRRVREIRSPRDADGNLIDYETDDEYYANLVRDENLTSWEREGRRLTPFWCADSILC